MMTLLIGRPTYAESMVVFDNDPTERWAVFFPTIAKSFQPSLYPALVPVPFPEFVAAAHTSVPRWLRVAEDFKSAVDLHWSTVVHPNQYAQLSFLSMVMALESYHPLVFSGKYMDDDDYKAAIGDWQAQIPKTLELSHCRVWEVTSNLGTSTGYANGLPKSYGIFRMRHGSDY